MERYKESGQMLKDLLGGNLNDRTPQHIAQNIRSMRPNLMVNEADDPERDNVIIFPSFAGLRSLLYTPISNTDTIYSCDFSGISLSSDFISSSSPLLYIYLQAYFPISADGLSASA